MSPDHPAWQRHRARYCDGSKTKGKNKGSGGEDNSREWTGLDFPESQRAMQGRQREMEAAGYEVVGAWCPYNPQGHETDRDIEFI